MFDNDADLFFVHISHITIAGNPGVIFLITRLIFTDHIFKDAVHRAVFFIPVLTGQYRIDTLIRTGILVVIRSQRQASPYDLIVQIRYNGIGDLFIVIILFAWYIVLIGVIIVPVPIIFVRIPIAKIPVIRPVSVTGKALTVHLVYDFPNRKYHKYNDPHKA